MPDLDLERENSQPLPPANRPPILDTMGPHPFKESEFPAGKGHCDLCGGGPDAEIHQPHVEPLVRIAEALENEVIPAAIRMADALERLAAYFEEKGF